MQNEITPEYLASQGLSESFPERFWSKVNKTGPLHPYDKSLGICWEWTKFTVKGYGQIDSCCADNWRRIASHRASWIIHNGPIPDGLHVCHSCDNRLCVNPDHLWLGTNLENIHDSMKKGRRARPKGWRNGELHPRAILTDSMAIFIKSMAGKNIMTQKEMSILFGVCYSTINKVATGKQWKHIK